MKALLSTVLKRAANTRGKWNIACDANMDPSEFAEGVWVMGSRAEGKAPPQGSATYCAEEKGGVEVRKRQDYFVVSESFEGKSTMWMWSTSIFRRHTRR